MNISRSLTPFLLAGAIVTAAAGLAIGRGPSQEPPAAPIVTGCAIRLTAAGPSIIQNSTHRCTGASSVSILPSGDLEIIQTVSAPIISTTVDEDETLSARGILAGASRGGRATTVRFYSTKNRTRLRADSPLLVGAWNNIWVTWVHSA